MVIGNGMLARAFSHFKDNSDVVIFASGTANSLETDAKEFRRELDALMKARQDHADALIVYLSTCSISDPDRLATPYVQHKLNVERQLEQWGVPYLIIRLPAVIGYSNLALTLPFVIRDKIINNQELTIWSNAIRFPIDIDDAVAISSELISSKSFENSCVNVALQPYSIPMIVREIEAQLNKRCIPKELPRGSHYELDLSTAHEIANSLGIQHDKEYLRRVIKKYFNA